MCVCAQLCPILCGLMDCGPLGSSLHGILQASILKWIAISSFRGSSQQKDQTCFSCTGRGILYHWASWEARPHLEGLLKCRHGAILPKVSDCLGLGLNLSLAFLTSSQAHAAAADWGLWSENHCCG